MNDNEIELLDDREIDLKDQGRAPRINVGDLIVKSYYNYVVYQTNGEILGNCKYIGTKSVVYWQNLHQVTKTVYLFEKDEIEPTYQFDLPVIYYGITRDTLELNNGNIYSIGPDLDHPDPLATPARVNQSLKRLKNDLTRLKRFKR